MKSLGLRLILLYSGEEGGGEEGAEGGGEEGGGGGETEREGKRRESRK